MSIRKKGQRWEVRVRIGSGQRFERTLPRGATRDDARALETQVRRASIDAAAGRKPKHLIDEVVEQYVNTIAKNLKSYKKELQYRIKILRGYTDGKPLDDLVTIAERIKAEGQRVGLAPPSINRYISILRRWGNLAERWGMTDLPLGRRIKLLPERSERHIYLTPEQVGILAGKTDPITADMIRFACLSGLRLGEMLNLQKTQIRDGLLILDANTKGGRPRGIPLPPEAIQIAESRLPWGLSKDQLSARWTKARETAGLEHIHWHDLRHTYASWLVQADQPLTVIRDLLGHSSLAVTNRYSHLAPAHLVSAVGFLPSLGGKVGETKPIPRKKKAA